MRGRISLTHDCVKWSIIVALAFTLWVCNIATIMMLHQTILNVAEVVHSRIGNVTATCTACLSLGGGTT